MSLNGIQPDNIDAAALILYFNLLATIFAGWNIMSSTSGMPGVLLSVAVITSTDTFAVPGAAAFLLVNAALIFALTML
jgi:hypothetical protein